MPGKALILLEHERKQVRRPSLHAITAARQLSDGFGLLLLGSGLDEMAKSVASYGAEDILVADDASLSEPLADRYATVIAKAFDAIGANTLIASSSTFSKDILPRTAALLDAPMLTDVLAIEDDGKTFRRPINAGSMLASVQVNSERKVITIRASNFAAPESLTTETPIKRLPVDPGSLPNGMQFVSREERVSERPDLTEARVVVGGGRPLKDKETFDRLVGGLADTLGGAIGATRAAVDTGLAPNDYQIGQTGKVIAPDLYIALGISGAIQHLAGIKDSRIIVAINKDADAPIFQTATYGLVGDLHQVVPALIEALRKQH